MARHTSGRNGQTHPVRGKNPNHVLQICSSSEPENCFLLASPAQGVHAFVGCHFHPLSHCFEIRAPRSQRSWQGFSLSSPSSSNLGCCCTLHHGGRFQNLKPHLCWYCAHQSSTGSSPVSRICISLLRRVWERGRTSQTYCNSSSHSLKQQKNPSLPGKPNTQQPQCPKRKLLCHPQIAAEGKQQAGSRQVSPWGQHIVSLLCSKV